MERRLRLFDVVYRKQDPHRIEGKILYAEEIENEELKYIVLFRGEEKLFSYFASELCLSNETIDTIFSKSILQQHPLQQDELSYQEIQSTIDSNCSNPNSRRSVWYDILFYKHDALSQPTNENLPIRTVILRLLQYPIPDEIRCFLWSEVLNVRKSYEFGYYSIIRGKQFSIPYNSLSVIEADLNRMNITPSEHRQMLRLLTSIYNHDPIMGYAQGMHFLAYALLQLFTEEEAFFIFLRIVDFLPSNYYDSNLEGINTDLLVIAAILNKYDNFLYSLMEEKTGNLIFFLTPVYKWLVDLFSDPFQITFTFQVLDLLFCLGNWLLVIAPVAIIMDNHKEFICCDTMEDVSDVFTSIPECMTKSSMLLIIQNIYELWLRSNKNEIDQFRIELRKESETPTIREVTSTNDEQYGVVKELCKAEVSKEEEKEKNLCLSLQMSMHMRQLSSNFKRVSGFELEEEGLKRNQLRKSFGLNPSECLPSFNDFSECDEETDENPWRESILEDESVKSENHLLNAEDLSEHTLDTLSNDYTQDDEESIDNKGFIGGIQLNMKWPQVDLLFKKALQLYDHIRDQRTYNVTSERKEHVSDGKFLDQKALNIDKEYLSSYRSATATISVQ